MNFLIGDSEIGGKKFVKMSLHEGNIKFFKKLSNYETFEAFLGQFRIKFCVRQQYICEF